MMLLPLSIYHTAFTASSEPYTLEGWKLTLPWDVNELYVGGADEILQPELLTYESIWFDRTDVFDYTCPEGGATTATATYARTELRHLTDNAWNSQTEMKVVWSDVDMPDGEKTVVFQTHDVNAPEFKFVYTGAGAVNSDGLLRILYKATEGAGDTTVVIKNDISRGDQVPLRVRRYVDKLEVYVGANVDGTVPDFTTVGGVEFSRDGTNGTYFWKMGNYLQIDNAPYTDSPAYTIRHHTGTWSNPATITGGTGFSPTDISDLQLWLDAADASTITETAGAVSQWDDKSGNSNHATQSTGSAQPTTGTRTLNGLNVLDTTSTGSADYMIIPSIPYNGTNGFTYFVVAEADQFTTPAGARALFGGKAGAPELRVDDTPAELEVVRTNQVVILNVAGSLSTSTPYIFAAKTKSTGSYATVNGTLSNSTSNNPSYTKSIDTILNTSNPNYNEGWDGKYAELCIFNRQLTDTELNQVGNYLANKWGITWTDI